MKFDKNETKKILFTAKANLKAIRKKFDAAGNESDTGDERITLAGRPIVYGALSDDRGGFNVRFLTNSARFKPRTLALFHHSYKIVLGNTQNETLRIAPDTTGVSVEFDLPDTQAAADVATLVEDEYVQGMSFSMLIDDDLKYEIVKSGNIDIMEVSQFNCDEVTVTALPSFDETSIGIKPDVIQSDGGSVNMSAAPERVAQALKLQQLKLNSIAL